LIHLSCPLGAGNFVGTTAGFDLPRPLVQMLDLSEDQYSADTHCPTSPTIFAS
jgi:hypothetical protein